MNESAEPVETTSARLSFSTAARKRSKSSLALNSEPSSEVPAAAAAASSSGTGANGSSASIWPGPGGSDVLPPSTMLPAGGDGGGGRARTPFASAALRGAALVPAGLRVGGLALDYALDWLVVLLSVVVLASSENARPSSGYVPKALLASTNYPLLASTVPAWSVPCYALLLPALLLGLHGAALRRPLLETHHLLLGLLTSVLLTGAATNVIKCPVGRLRPDFNARCWPDGVVSWAKEDAWGGWPKCSGDPRVVAEGLKSFPSGHSSWSASGLCYATWFLLDRLAPFGPAGWGHPWRLLVACCPALAAAAVGVSRVVDYWHHPSDVAAGLALGALVSWLCYRQQRGRLAELDPWSYGGCLGGGGGSGGNGGGDGGGAGGYLRLEPDAVPLLQGGAGPQLQQQQGLPV